MASKRALVILVAATAVVLVTPLVLAVNEQFALAGSMCAGLLLGVAVYFRRRPPRGPGGTDDGGSDGMIGVIGGSSDC